MWDIGYRTIQELETDKGILASGKEEIFGCIFGRDSLITSLGLLQVYEKTGDAYLLRLVEKVLVNLMQLQGQEVNIESGEEPGKCIHEFRPADHEHLTKNLSEPWYIYPDNIMRNYDSVDATPLLLIAIHEYYKVSRDDAFLKKALPNVFAAIEWLVAHGDSNQDGFIDYRFHPDRKHGGLRTQSWMDSAESVFHANGDPVAYPIAPVEAQAYAYVALRAWSDALKDMDAQLASDLGSRADALKKIFNERFVINDNGRFSLAFAIDGNGVQLAASRSSMGHCLWAVWKRDDGTLDGILDDDLIPLLVERLMGLDMFEPRAGMRTLSSGSERFDPRSYHNGSIWPHDTAILIKGFENFGYLEEGERLRTALLSAYEHFQTPIELFVFDEGRYEEYCSLSGQKGCRKQAWSAAALLGETLGPAR